MPDSRNLFRQFFPVLLISSLASAQSSGPPSALRQEVVDTIHGRVMSDPYRYFEDAKDPRTMAWVRAQDEWARAYVRSAADFLSLRREVGELAEATVYSAPVVRGRREFYSTFSASGPGSAIDVYVKEGSGRARLLITKDSVRSRFGETPLTFAPSPDGSLLVMGAAASGTIWLTLRVFDVRRGTWLRDSIANVHRALGSVSWRPDGRGFYYTRFGREGELGAGDVYLHRLGESAEALAFRSDSTRQRVVTHSISPGGRYLVFTITNTARSTTEAAALDVALPTSAPQWLALGTGTHAPAGEVDGELVFHTTAGGPRGRVVAINPANGRVREVVGEQTATISTWPGVGVNVVGGRLLIAYVDASRLDLRIVSLDGRTTTRVAMPAIGSVWSGFVGSPSQASVYYSLQQLADPGTVYRLDLATGRSTPYLRPRLSYDPAQLTTERLTFPSFDGTAVPLHIVRRRDLPRDGRAPLIMYAYGFGSWIAAPWYQPMMASWVRRGGVWAIAGVRGGGEFGDAWHEAGARRNKQVGIDDYLAATAWLSANRYTSADRMIAHSSSAGGPLVAAATLQRPELFRAAIHDYGIFDMMRYERFGHAQHWRSDYGSVSDPADFDVLRAYSPYGTLKPGVCYPATFLAPGELDQTAPAFHSWKFAAALQAHGTGCSRTVVRTTWGAGHSSGATPRDAADTWADELGFLQRVLPAGAMSVRPAPR